MIEKWYRGHDGSKNATDNFGIIWLADDPKYAQIYADEYPNGVVSTVFVNMDKINYLDWYYDEDFDPYDPDMSLLKNYMKEQGCNAYTFPLNDGITVLALLTTEPIVKVEKTIIENKKYRNMKIRLTESKLKQIVAESVKKVLKETWGEFDLKNVYDLHSGRILDRFRNGEYNNLEKFSGYPDDWFDSEQGGKCFDEWCKMSERLPGGGDQLDKLVANNPIFKKWYEALHKRYESEYSWELYEIMKQEVLDALESEKEHAISHDSWLKNAKHNYLSDDDIYDFDGRHPNRETLHTAGSANRDLMNIDRQRKNKNN
jgi:hypothetical protein